MDEAYYVTAVASTMLQQYVAPVCLSCDSERIIGGPIRLCNGMATLSMRCPKCGTRWTARIWIAQKVDFHVKIIDCEVVSIK